MSMISRCVYGYLSELQVLSSNCDVAKALILAFLVWLREALDASKRRVLKRITEKPVPRNASAITAFWPVHQV